MGVLLVAVEPQVLSCGWGKEQRGGRPLTTPSVLPQNWGGNEQNSTVTYMVLKAMAKDRCHLALCHDEFRGPRSGLCRSGGISNNNKNSLYNHIFGGSNITIQSSMRDIGDEPRSYIKDDTYAGIPHSKISQYANMRTTDLVYISTSARSVLISTKT
ncbi:uncharacterized protein TNCV_4378221 [Trichonephila clavipes]|nr:uncharacterized protein TNCV_4378221 [Trichonephila clavipes]